MPHLVERIPAVFVKQENETLSDSFVGGWLVPLACALFRKWAPDLSFGIRFRLRQDFGEDFSTNVWFCLGFRGTR